MLTIEQEKINQDRDTIDLKVIDVESPGIQRYP